MIGLHFWDGLKFEVLFCNPFPLICHGGFGVFTMAATMGAPKEQVLRSGGGRQ